MNKVINIAVAGLGGQGVLTVTDILAEILFDAGYDVKKSEVHGMSQRGGSVSSEVRFGEKVASPMIPAGEADYLLILEPTQVEVNRAKLKSGGVMITPADVPTDELENPRAVNIMMLGALSKYFDFSESTWLDVIHNNLAERLHKMNDAAFYAGRR